MQLEIACCSDKGLVRDHNEDALASDEDLGVVVLADGMGGCQAGEVASAMAVKTVTEELSKTLSSKTFQANHYVTHLLEQAIIKANQVIYEAAEQQVRYQGMGTTIVAAIFHKDRVSVAHVGDSRLYRLRNNALKQITTDHSVLQELIDSNLYAPEHARHYPNKNLITRALGVNEMVNVDTQEVEVLLDDIYLLCSDGLNDMLEDDDIFAILTDNQTNLAEATQKLIEAANIKGGEDNISVVLVHPLSFEGVSPPSRWEWLIRLWPFSRKNSF